VSGAARTGDELSEAPDLEPNPREVVSAVEGYERWAPTYDSAPNPLLAREERYLTPLLTKLHFNSALDLACGTGRWLEKLLRGSCVLGVGIDLSAEMLRVAEKKNTISGRLVQATWQDLPLAASAFDLALCSFALGHIYDLASAVCELKRVSKAGANVFVSDLHPEAHQRGWRVGFRDHRASVQIQMQSRSTHEIAAAFQSNGFECVAQQPLWLGQPEQPVFTHAGKLSEFEDACHVPAVLVCHFRRLRSL
jgi:ubiquinone/menaquinone biosynthesis C-methylase UbiE